MHSNLSFVCPLQDACVTSDRYGHSRNVEIIHQEVQLLPHSIRCRCTSVLESSRWRPAKLCIHINICASLEAKHYIIRQHLFSRTSTSPSVIDFRPFSTVTNQQSSHGDVRRQVSHRVMGLAVTCLRRCSSGIPVHRLRPSRPLRPSFPTGDWSSAASSPTPCWQWSRPPQLTT